MKERPILPFDTYFLWRERERERENLNSQCFILYFFGRKVVSQSLSHVIHQRYHTRTLVEKRISSAKVVSGVHCLPTGLLAVFQNKCYERTLGTFPCSVAVRQVQSAKWVGYGQRNKFGLWHIWRHVLAIAAVLRNESRNMLLDYQVDKHDMFCPTEKFRRAA